MAFTGLLGNRPIEPHLRSQDRDKECSGDAGAARLTDTQDQSISFSSQRAASISLWLGAAAKIMRTPAFFWRDTCGFRTQYPRPHERPWRCGIQLHEQSSRWRL